MMNEPLTSEELSNLRTLVAIAGATFRGGSKVDAIWLAHRDALYEKLGRIRDQIDKATE